MAEESARPGACRSKVGCDAMDEPCTNRIRPAGPEGSPRCLFQRNKRTSLPFCIQCSSPRMAVVAAERGLFILELLVGSSRVPASRLLRRARRSFMFYLVGFDDARPLVDFRLDVSSELLWRHRHRSCALLPPRLDDIRARENFIDLGVEQGDDRLGCPGRRHDADPNRRLVPGNSCLRERRYVGKNGKAHLAFRRDPLAPPALYPPPHAR